MKISPLTAVLKCPHYDKGHCRHEPEGTAEVPSVRDGYRWEDDLYHCDLCGGEPQCVRVCSTGAIEIEYD